MTDAPEKPASDSKSLPNDLLDLYDEFTEFRDTCSFFCEAAISLLLRSSDLDRYALEGIASFSAQIKEKACELDDQLKRLTEKPRR